MPIRILAVAMFAVVLSACTGVDALTQEQEAWCVSKAAPGANPIDQAARVEGVPTVAAWVADQLELQVEVEQWIDLSWTMLVEVPEGVTAEDVDRFEDFVDTHDADLKSVYQSYFKDDAGKRACASAYELRGGA